MTVQPQREAGFTLIEMMIALMIFGMVAAAGVALLSFSVRAQAATAARLDDVGAYSRLSSALAADLAQAVERPTRDLRGGLLPAFQGENGGTTGPFLQLVRGGWTNLDEAARPGDQRVEYRLEKGLLLRTAYPMLDGAVPYPAATMADKVASVSLRYRLAGAWADRWVQRPEAPLPQALELVVTRVDGVQVRAVYLVGTGYIADTAVVGGQP